MKKELFIVRTVMVGLVMAAVMVAAPASAKNTKKEVSPVIAIQPTIENIATEDATTMLRVSFETANPVKFELSVNDAEGTVIYTKEFESAKFNKYLKLVNEGGESETPLFVTIKLPNGDKHTYGVTSKDKVVTEVVVNKL